MLFSNASLVDSFPVAWGLFETGLIPAHADCIYNYTGEEGESRNSWRKVKHGKCNVKKEKLEGLKKASGGRDCCPRFLKPADSTK